MKPILVVLMCLFMVLQYKLWFEDGGASSVWRIKKAIALQASENDQLKKRNAALVAEVQDLKHGQAAIEERARQDLGMVKKGEVYYRIVEHEK